MAIKILELRETEIDKRIAEVKRDMTLEGTKLKDLPVDILQDIKNLFSDSSFRSLYHNLDRLEFLEKFNYASLNEAHAVLTAINEKLNLIKERVDVEIFLKEGYDLDIDAMTEEFEKYELSKVFPNFKIQLLRELYRHPPKYLVTNYDDKKRIHIEEFVFRKFIIAFIQMIYNQMDLVVVNTGGEGSGKSCKCSADMYVCWWVLTQVGIINYAFDSKEIMFNSLQSLREAEDKHFHNKFRLFALDEGNELNRQNWKEPEVNTFFQRLRRERYNQRIKFINIPVIGEMIPNIILSRVNFIFEMSMENKTKSGTLKKGDVNFYIIPRAERIYSPYQKREITKDEIKEKFYEKIKDKSYLTGLPDGIVIKKYTTNGVWGWPQEKYVKEQKDTNATFTTDPGIKLSELQAFMLYKANVTPIMFKIRQGDIRYSAANAFCTTLKHYFEKNPDKLLKYEAIYKRKLEAKKGHAGAEEEVSDEVTEMSEEKYASEDD